MSAERLNGFYEGQRRRDERVLDRRDLRTLQFVRVLAFGMAAMGGLFQAIAFFKAQDIGGDIQVWVVGGLAIGFLAGEMIKLKRRVNDLAERLASTSEAD